MSSLPRLLTVLSLFPFLSAVGGDFASRTPADHLIYFELRDLPAISEQIDASPMGKAYRDFDWKSAILHLAKLRDFDLEMVDVDAPDVSTEEISKILDRIEGGWKTLSDHMNGDWVMTMGNFEDTMDVFSANQEIRSQFQTGVMPLLQDEELDEAALLLELERENELDAAEAASLLGQFTFLADVRDGEALEATLVTWMQELRPHLAEMEGSVHYKTTTRDGATLHHLTLPGPDNAPTIGLHWAIHNGVWASTFTEKSLRKTLDRLNTPPARALASDPAFQESVRALGKTDSLFYMDWGNLDRLLRKAAREAGDMPAVGSFNPDSLLDWLGLNALLPLAQGSSFQKEGIQTVARMGFTRETGLSRMMLDPSERPAPTPDFIHKDVGQFASLHWNIGDAWTRMETEMMTLAPEAAAGIGMVRMMASGQLGFDLKLQFLDHLDSGMVLIQSIDPQVMEELAAVMTEEDPAAIMEVSMEHPTGGSNYLFGIELKDPEAIQEAMDRLMTRWGVVQTPETIMGVDVINPLPANLAGGMMDEFMHLAFVGDWLIISVGERSLLEEALEANQDESLRLWQDPAYQSLRARLPELTHSLEYSSGEQQQNALKMMQSSFQMLADEEDELEVPDLSLLGSFMHKILGTSTRKGLTFTAKSFMEYQAQP